MSCGCKRDVTTVSQHSNPRTSRELVLAALARSVAVAPIGAKCILQDVADDTSSFNELQAGSDWWAAYIKSYLSPVCDVV